MDLSTKAFDLFKFHNLVKDVISLDNPIVLTINKDVPQFECLKIYENKIVLKFETGDFTFDLVNLDDYGYSVDDIIVNIICFLDMRLIMPKILRDE